MNLEDFKNDLTKSLYGMTKDEAVQKGICVQCTKIPLRAVFIQMLEIENTRFPAYVKSVLTILPKLKNHITMMMNPLSKGYYYE